MTADGKTTDVSRCGGTFSNTSWKVKSTLRRCKFCVASVLHCANDQCRDEHGVNVKLLTGAFIKQKG